MVAGNPQPRECWVRPACGWVLPAGPRPAQVPAHERQRGGRCRGGGDSADRAIVPGWVETGGYAPAYGGGPTRPRAASTKVSARLEPSVAAPSAAPETVGGSAQSVTGEAPELFTRIATRRLRVWDLAHRRSASESSVEQILVCPIQVAFVDAADPSLPWMDKRVLAAVCCAVG